MIYKKQLFFIFYLGVIYKILFLYCVCFALDFNNSTELSMGGSGRAVTKGGIYYHLLNPASLAYPQYFKAGIFYIFPIKPQPSYWGVSLVETQKIPIALSYITQKQSKTQYLTVSIASFIVPNWSLGLSINRLKTPQNTYWNIQTGFLVQPKKSRFSFGVTGDYLLPVKGPFKEKSLYGLGLAYTPYHWLHLRADTLYHKAQKLWSMVGGVQITMNSFFIVQTGINWNFTYKIPMFSGGLGVYTQYFYINYALKQNKNRTQKLLHTLNLQIKF